MDDFQINLAAQIVVDDVLSQDVDFATVREVLEEGREEWSYYDSNDDQEKTLPEESDEEAVKIQARVHEILAMLRDRVDMVAVD